MILPKHTDEPSVHPPTPAATLWRLARLHGALQQESGWNAMPILLESLAQAQNGLQTLGALEQQVGASWEDANTAIRAVYDAAAATEDADLVMRLGFPDPRIKDKDYVGPVDVSTVVATHFKPQKQIFSTISFEEAHGATAYWLLEIRVLGDGTEAIDALVENYAPYFSRVRLPVGKHRFVIESRNPSKHARTGEFTLEVPAL